MEIHPVLLVLALALAAAPARSQPGGGQDGGRRGAGPRGGVQGGDGAGPGGGGGCREDAERLCADARSGGRDAVKSCLRSHKDELSDSCRQQIRAHQSAQAGGSAADGAGGDSGGGKQAASGSQDGGGKGPGACRDDAKRLCADAFAAGPEAVKRCMRSHKDALSQPCRDQMAKMSEAKLDQSASQGPKADADGFKDAVRLLASSCANERGLFCGGVEPKDGALMRCLMEHRDDAMPDCRRALDAAKPYAQARKTAAGSGAATSAAAPAATAQPADEDPPEGGDD